ncbi:MAG TPA: DUF5996 family protein, partial [Balneolaceae bacterium]|nr:DUF5996 family protein [Balneolaceae bacterium]
MNQSFSSSNTQIAWPHIAKLSKWEETFHTLYHWSQIVGKVRLEYMPWINHSWHVTLYVSSRGLTTSLIPHPEGAFEIEFNFIDHLLGVQSVSGEHISFGLESMTVADFYEKIIEGLQQLNIDCNIYTKPVEMPGTVSHFYENTRYDTYDKEAVRQYWLALTNVQQVFTQFRSRFIGKVSPVHFFWGAFDLAVTRFSGNEAPKHPGGAPNCADWVMEEAYSHEVSGAGFWPGTGLGEAAFYSYAYPEPDGYQQAV